MEQLAKYHKRRNADRKISAIVLPLLCAGLIACTGSNQEDTSIRSESVRSEDETREIAIESNDTHAANPFSKVSATVNSDMHETFPDKVSKTVLSGVARQTENYLANEDRSDKSGTSWRCETINTDNEEGKVSLKFNPDNSGTVNNSTMRWRVTTENILVISIPKIGVVRLSGIEFELEGGEVVQFTTIDDKAEHSNCARM